MTYPEKGAEYRHKPAWLDRTKAEENRACGGKMADGGVADDDEAAQAKSMGREALDQELAARELAMMKIQDPELRATVQNRRAQEEMNELTPKKQFDI